MHIRSKINSEGFMSIEALTHVFDVEGMNTRIVIVPVPADEGEIAFVDGLLSGVESAGYRFHLMRDLPMGSTNEGEASIVATALTFIKSDEPTGNPLHLRLVEDEIVLERS